MKAFFATTALLGLFGLVSAAPAPVPQIPASGNVVKPSVRSQYAVSAGAISYNTGVGKIFKSGRSTDITTLLTFDFPAAAAGKTCTFHFYAESTVTVTGSGQFQLYTSLAPPTGSTTTWPPGNRRNNHVGTLRVVKPGEATWVDGNPVTAKSFPCPTGTVGYELVGVYDNDDIAWSGSGSGTYFTY